MRIIFFFKKKDKLGWWGAREHVEWSQMIKERIFTNPCPIISISLADDDEMWGLLIRVGREEKEQHSIYLLVVQTDYGNIEDTLNLIIEFRCSDEVNPRVKPYKFTNQKLKELGLDFTPVKQCLYETVKSLQENGHLPVPSPASQQEEDSVPIQA